MYDNLEFSRNKFKAHFIFEGGKHPKSVLVMFMCYLSRVQHSCLKLPSSFWRVCRTGPTGGEEKRAQAGTTVASRYTPTSGNGSRNTRPRRCRGSWWNLKWWRQTWNSCGSSCGSLHLLTSFSSSHRVGRRRSQWGRTPLSWTPFWSQYTGCFVVLGETGWSSAPAHHS